MNDVDGWSHAGSSRRSRRSALLAVSAPAMAGSPADGAAWGACADAGCGRGRLAVRDVQGAEGLRATRARARSSSPSRACRRRIRAHRIGALFVNPAGPAAAPSTTTQAIGTDLFGAGQRPLRPRRLRPARRRAEPRPRSTARSTRRRRASTRSRSRRPRTSTSRRSIAKDKAYIKRCVSLNKRILPYVSTANVARDMDGIRAAMGDRKLNYFGFSYGTFLGATYASLFPDNYRAMVLDGPVDANSYINKPQADLREQSAGFERALGGSSRPARPSRRSATSAAGIRWAAYDALVGQAQRARPIPARRTSADDPRPVNGDDIIAAHDPSRCTRSRSGRCSRRRCRGRERGRRHRRLRDLADAFWGNNEDGTFDPGSDRYFTIGAIEQKYPTRSADLPRRRRQLVGHVRLHLLVQHRLHRAELRRSGRSTRRTSFRGPFKASKSAPTVLEVATTYDPATPYRGAKRLAAQLGNVRFLTMVGDGHTAYGGNSSASTRRRGADRDADAAGRRHGLPADGAVHRAAGSLRRPDVGAQGRRQCLAARAAIPRHAVARAVRAGCASPGAQRVRLRPQARRPGDARSGRRRPRSCGACRGCARRPCPRAAPPRDRRRGPQRATRSAATSRNAPGSIDGQVAVPAVAREVEIVAPEAEGVRAARADRRRRHRAPSRRPPDPTRARVPL